MTTNPTSAPASHQARLADVMEQVIARVKAGEPVDADVLRADYPDLADDLLRLLPAVQVMADLSRSSEPEASATDHPALPLGDLGDFRLIREVGRGGMGVVYEAEQVSLNRRVALKVLPYAATMDPRALQRFKNEAKAAASLRHEHIVHVYGVGVERGVHFYAMEFVDGMTLAQVIPARQVHADPPGSRSRLPGGTSAPVPPGRRDLPETATVAALSTERGRPKGRDFYRRAAELIADAADALEHAHGLGIVHRDVKPANLLLDAAGKVYVSDFGLARLGTDAGLTMTGDLIGTLRYMAPEQALARHGLADHRVDVYGLGATLYELLTGKPAVRGEEKADILADLAFGDPVPPRRLDRAIPAELETVALKCLAKEPWERYATARELAEDLRRWLADRAITAKPPTLRYRAGKWAGRHRAIVTVTLVFLLAATVGLAAGVVLLNAANRQEARQRDRAQENLRTAMEALHETAWPANSPHPTAPATPEETRRLEKLLAFYQQFAEKNGDDPVLRLETSKAHLRIGKIYTTLGNKEQAEGEIRTAVDQAAALAADRPGDQVAATNHTNCLYELGAFLRTERRPLEATPVLRAALTADDSVDGNVGTIAHSHWALANIHKDARRPADAERHFRQALQYHERLMALEPNLVQHHGSLGAYLGDFANLLVSLGRMDEAEAVARRAVAMTTTASGQDARNLHCRQNLLIHYDTLVRIAEARKQPGQRLDAMLSRAAALEEIVADFPRRPEFRPRLHPAFYNVGYCLYEVNRHAEALSWLEKVAEGSGPYTRAIHLRVWIRLTAADGSLRKPAEAVRLSTPFAAQESAADVGSWLTLLGWAQHQAGDSKAALATLERAAHTQGGDTDVWFVRAMVLHKLGESDRARQDFAAAARGMDERDELRTDPMLITVRAEAARELGLTDGGTPKPAGKANDGK